MRLSPQHRRRVQADRSELYAQGTAVASAGSTMIAVRILLLLTLLGLASTAAAFGTAPSCSVATRPQMMGVALYGGQQNVRSLSLLLLAAGLSCVRTHVCEESMSWSARPIAALRLPNEHSLVSTYHCVSCNRLPRAANLKLRCCVGTCRHKPASQRRLAP
jgi:hypothetical protein